VSELASAVERVIGSPQRRAEMSAKGMAHAAAFTVERMARGTLQTYERALA
jgi:hypothetical protein